MVPLSQRPEGDSATIDSTLAEAVLAEEVGLDAVWLTEHHFVGESVYADPIVFAAAIAARTTRVKIGLAVVEMALNHPVRVAVQTALVDNLSHGRLIVGTGRGSAFNHYEYAGFGTTLEQGRERIEESEELLVKAWTAKEPAPRGEALEGGDPRDAADAVPEAPPAAGEGRAERGLRQGDGGAGQADTDGRARRPGDSRQGEHLQVGHVRIWLLGRGGRGGGRQYMDVDGRMGRPDLCRGEGARRGGLPARAGALHDRAARTLNPLVGGDEGPNPSDFEDRFDKAYMVGTPDQVAEQLIELQGSGVPNVMLKLNTGQMDPGAVSGMMRLLGEQVLPRVHQERKQA